jgi:hypothetical protein
MQGPALLSDDRFPLYCAAAQHRDSMLTRALEVSHPGGVKSIRMAAIPLRL